MGVMDTIRTGDNARKNFRRPLRGARMRITVPPAIASTSSPSISSSERGVRDCLNSARHPRTTSSGS
jgi:hypothetical protein